MHRALAALGHPERSLPPVVHVAGTNGKGSCCAFLRAIAEAADQRVHVYTSPHLVRFHERIRLAGTLVEEATLESTLAEVEERNAGAPITVFEITTAAAFLLFSRVSADLLVLETGLGGRYDATNVVDRPAATAITSISMDHMEYLGDTLDKIAWEKAGILKPGVPCTVGADASLAVLQPAAAEAGAPLLARDRDWRIEQSDDGGLRYADAAGALDLPPPSLAGPHQLDNAGIAIAAMRAWNPPWLSAGAIANGLAAAEWPARMQRLRGRLAATLPPGWELWLDGGHNPAAGRALAAHLHKWREAAPERPVHLIIGMKASKAAAEFLAPLLPPLADTVWAVAEPGQHLAMPVAEIVAASGGAARPGPTVEAALSALPPRAAAVHPPARVLICGSLYLAGEVLKAEEA
jgi:dihydrofolate synthase / folylpolyglutamate synthase